MLSSAVMALGLHPAIGYIDFVPGSSVEGSFTVINNEGSAQSIRVYVEGTTANFVTIHDPSFSLAAGGQQPVRYTVIVPQSVEAESFDIYVSPAAEGSGSVVAVVRIGHKIVFREPVIAKAPEFAQETIGQEPESLEENITGPRHEIISRTPQTAGDYYTTPSGEVAAVAQPLEFSVILLAIGILFLGGSLALWLRSKRPGLRETKW